MLVNPPEEFYRNKVLRVIFNNNRRQNFYFIIITSTLFIYFTLQMVLKMFFSSLCGFFSF